MQSDNLIDENSWDKSNENAFYQEKMENITGDGIYNIFKNLSADFCKSEYHTDKTNLFFGAKPEEERKNYLEQWKEKYKQAKENSKECFKSPSFSWTGDDKNKEFAPFIFFETIDLKEIEGDEAIANYVKQFVYYINQLLSDRDFRNFVFYEFAIANTEYKNKSIAEFGNKIDSDFFTKCDKVNLKLFKDCGLLYIAAQLVDNLATSLRNMRFIEYLKKTPAIPVIVLKEMLFDYYFYDEFSSHQNIVGVIIESIAKTDFTSYSYSKKYKDELSALGFLLNPNNHWYNKVNFYTMNTDADGQIKEALIGKCAEIFNKPETKNINLYNFMTISPYKNVYSFVSDYLRDNKNKNSSARQKLIAGLKTWAKNNDNFIDYDCIEKITSVSYGDHSFRYSYFFPCDTEFNKIIADHCQNAIKTHLETIDNIFNRVEEYLSIKRRVEGFFSIKLNINIDLSNEPYKSHGKDVAWLSLYIFLLLLCFGAMIAGFILIPITPLKFLCLFVLYPISEIYNPMKKRCIKINDDRIYNAKLCIYKSTSKNLAINNLSWDMLRRDEIKRALNEQFPDSQNPLDQNQI
ncbi:MAG: hypothetical protein IJU86_01325 [Firmicutes bacterium]|nr:hypothetical protein [Bacillota bacterium]